MQLGTENRTKVIMAAVLGVVALLLLVRFLTSDSEPVAGSVSQAAPALPTSSRPAARRTAGGKAPRTTAAPSLDPTLRLDLLKDSEETKYSGSGRNIFTAASEPIPHPRSNGTTDKKKDVYTPPPPPQPPPITLKFFGFASKPGEPKRIFLSQDGDVFIASEGDIINRRYRVLRITGTSVEVEDVLNNNRQSIPLTQG
jgi:hypothetical protein